eukprot:scaffold22636_cov28-Tisochrysis_lutea.AAC.1
MHTSIHSLPPLSLLPEAIQVAGDGGNVDNRQSSFPLAVGCLSHSPFPFPLQLRRQLALVEAAGLVGLKRELESAKEGGGRERESEGERAREGDGWRWRAMEGA